MIHRFVILFAAIVCNLTGLAQPTPWNAALDHVSRDLHFISDDGEFEAQLSGSVDMRTYYFAQRPIGFVFPRPGSNNHTQYSPRLTLNLDAFYGERLYGFVKFRWDDGLDPGYQNNSVRLDEIFLRGTVIMNALDVQVGKFATVFGNWAGRHGAWESPFISPPLPYDEATSVTDNAAPPNATAFANRANALINKSTWTPVIWGPVYTEGIAAFGSYEDFSIAVTGTNRPLSARPPSWNDRDFDNNPTFTGRLGWSPSAEWKFGVSGMIGPYLLNSAQSSLPAGTSINDFDQIVVGGDLSWARGPWQVWAEFIYSRFDVPNVGNADIYSYYLEGKYKISANFFTALRWGQQFYNKVDTPSGPAKWDNDVLRTEAAFGIRLDRHTQLKIQYTYQYQDASFQDGTQQVAAEATLRF